MTAAPILFDAAALTIFWEHADAMSLSNLTCVQLAIEGINVPWDLDEYDEDGMEKIFLNLAKPPKEATANAGRLRDVLPFVVTGKSKMRFVGAANLVIFFKTLSHPLDPSNMTWTVIKNFLEQHKALKERESLDLRMIRVSRRSPRLYQYTTGSSRLTTTYIVG